MQGTIARMHASTAAMHRAILDDRRRRLDEAGHRLAEIEAVGDPSRGSERIRLREEMGVSAKFIEMSRKALDAEEKSVAYLEGRARRFERARWMPWREPPLPEDDPNNPAR